MNILFADHDASFSKLLPVLLETVSLEIEAQAQKINIPAAAANISKAVMPTQIRAALELGCFFISSESEATIPNPAEHLTGYWLLAIGYWLSGHLCSFASSRSRFIGVRRFNFSLRVYG